MVIGEAIDIAGAIRLTIDSSSLPTPLSAKRTSSTHPDGRKNCPTHHPKNRSGRNVSHAHTNAAKWGVGSIDQPRTRRAAGDQRQWENERSRRAEPRGISVVPKGKPIYTGKARCTLVTPTLGIGCSPTAAWGWGRLRSELSEPRGAQVDHCVGDTVPQPAYD